MIIIILYHTFIFDGPSLLVSDSVDYCLFNHFHHHNNSIVITPYTCARGQAIGLVCLSLAQNATLEDLKPIDVSESAKIMTACSFKMLGNVHESCKLCISIGWATSINHTHYQCYAPCYAYAQTAGLLHSLRRYKLKTAACTCAHRVGDLKSSSFYMQWLAVPQ